MSDDQTCEVPLLRPSYMDSPANASG